MIREDMRCKDQSGRDTAEEEGMEVAWYAQMRTWRASPDENKTVSSLFRRVVE